MTIYIKAPSRNSGVWGSAWHELDVDRIDQSVLNSIITYPHNDQKTLINCLKAPKISLQITGHITDDSDLPGADAIAKTINLMGISNEWYFGLRPKNSGFPQYKDENKTYDMAVQKINIIDEARHDGGLINYQMGLILKWSD